MPFQMDLRLQHLPDSDQAPLPHRLHFHHQLRYRLHLLLPLLPHLPLRCSPQQQAALWCLWSTLTCYTGLFTLSPYYFLPLSNMMLQYSQLKILKEKLVTITHFLDLSRRPYDCRRGTWRKSLFQVDHCQSWCLWTHSFVRHYPLDYSRQIYYPEWSVSSFSYYSLSSALARGSWPECLAKIVEIFTKPFLRTFGLRYHHFGCFPWYIIQDMYLLDPILPSLEE